MAETHRCPNGHDSEWADYCSQCGVTIAGAAAAAPAAAPTSAATPSAASPSAATPSVTSAPAAPSAGATTCPACHAPCDSTDVFCEACGADLATGAPSAPVTSTTTVPNGLVIEVRADRAYFERYVDSGQLDFPDPPAPSITLPVTQSELLIGRRSESRGVFPDIDASALTGDPAVSHKHASIVLDANGAWTVTDHGSTNGSRLDDNAELLVAGRVYPWPANEVLHVGAWTTLRVIAPAPGATPTATPTNKPAP